VELIDRFGLLPPQAQTLFRVAAVRQHAARLGIRRIEANAAGGSLLFRQDTCVEPLSLIRMIQSDARRYRLDGQDKLRFNLDLSDPQARFDAVHALLDRLAPGPGAGEAPAPARQGAHKNVH
jgi:transcription-repair coupling factor (superfamily II helicase)